MLIGECSECSVRQQQLEVVSFPKTSKCLPQLHFVFSSHRQKQTLRLTNDGIVIIAACEQEIHVLGSVGC